MSRVLPGTSACAIAALAVLISAPAPAKVLMQPQAEGRVQLVATTPLPRPRPDAKAEAADADEDVAEAAAADEEADEAADEAADASDDDEKVAGGSDTNESADEDETAGAGGEEAADRADAAEAVATPMPRNRPEELVQEVKPSWPLSPVIAESAAGDVKEALDHVLARRFEQALTAQRELGDPLAAKLIEFFYVRDGSVRAPHHRIAAFLKDNPEWPSQTLLRRRYEVALLSQRVDAETVIAVFEDSAPITSPGTIAYAGALEKSGELEQAKAIIRELWREAELTEGEEKLIRQRFGEWLTREDNKIRMARLLYGGNRAGGLRIAKELGGGSLKLAEARIAVLRGASNAAKALDAVPKELRADPLFILSRIQHMRRSGKEVEAAGMMLEAPTDPEVLIDPDAWAVERRIAARNLLEQGQAATAYDVMRVHAAQSDVDRLESDWLAGWIALSFLEDPTSARRHFAKLRRVAGRPISISRSEYWLGRATEAAGEYDLAFQHYRKAAEHSTTYYGQLALDRVTRDGMQAPKKPLQAAAARRIVQEREPLRAIRMLAQLGHERLAAGLLTNLAEESEDPLVVVGATEMVHALGIPSAIVQVGKLTGYKGHPTEAYSFTTDGIPPFANVGPEIEPALVYAIARQESLFDHQAGSHAGALGLMQLMPPTAQQMAKTHSLPYSKARLTSDPAYNAALGAAYLGELINQFGDAYALVFAAYNAGPGRVNQWLQRFGDPRTGAIDPIDWVEMIPFTETRNYVQRVMENLQVYRASLGNEGPLRIAQDLRIPDERRMIVEALPTEERPFESVFGTSPVASTPASPPSSLGYAPAPAATGFGFGFGGN